MDTPPLIAGRYSVDLQHSLPGAGGGLPAFAVIDAEHRRTPLVAVQMHRNLPARAGALAALTAPIDHLLYPVAHGAAPAPGGELAYFILCPAPPGPALSQALHPWSEATLLDLMLRPAAAALEALRQARVTHRAIRPDNVFQAAPDQPVTLGCAWASPPACLQPAIFEPPGVAMCLAAGRGEGNSADDMYALGVLLVTLALGHLPLAGLDDATIIRRKLELGSYTALVGDHRLPVAIADLARGMLAEDPEHRLSAALLLEPNLARARRSAAHPARRAQRPIQLENTPSAGDSKGAPRPDKQTGALIWEARQLAYELASNPSVGLAALQDGSIHHWLRRGLGDAGLALRVEEMMRAHGSVDDAQARRLLLLRAVAVLDPLAPLCWDGVAILPDGIGPALATALDTDPLTMARLQDLIAAEAISSWGQMRADRCDSNLLRMEARQLRAVQRQRSAPKSGLNHDDARLAYHLNPLLPCASPLLQGRLVLSVADLPAALNASRHDPAATRPIDAHVCAFIIARAERRFASELADLTPSDANPDGALAQLRLFARLQAMSIPRPLPELARWLAVRSISLGQLWHRRDRRIQTEAALRSLAEAGLIGPMLAMIENPVARATDLNESRKAAATAERIDAELFRLRTGSRERAAFAHQLGQELAAGLGLAILAGVLTVAALS